MTGLNGNKTCRGYAVLISSVQFRELSAVEQAAVRVYLVKCDACKAWNDQLAFMRDALSRWRSRE